MPEVQCRKAYVSVNVDVDEKGTVHPRFIRDRSNSLQMSCQLKESLQRICGRGPWVRTRFWYNRFPV